MKRFLVNLDNGANFDLSDVYKTIVQFPHGMEGTPMVTNSEFQWSKETAGVPTTSFVVSSEADSTNIYMVLSQYPDPGSKIYVEAEMLGEEDITIVDPESE